jgi:UDP-glucose 4-epimerase
LLDRNAEGVGCPQNSEYVNTSELVKLLAAGQGKRVRTTKLFNPVIQPLAKRLSVFSKLFGDLYYRKQGNEETYNVVDFSDSIKLTITRE